MPVGFNSPARNLFVLGASGVQTITNFFKSIDKSSTTDGVFVPDEIRYITSSQKYALAGSAEDSNSKGFGWVERQNYDLETGTLTTDFTTKISSLQSGVNTTLRAMELDVNENLIVVGKTGTIPWIAKYSSSGNGSWQSTTNSADVEYTGITSDSNGNYYACGSTPISGEAQPFVEKFDSNGNPGWGKSAYMLGRDVVLEKISANDRGEVVAVGYLEDDSAEKGYIVKIDTNTGEVLWDRTLERNISGFGGQYSDDGIYPADVRCTACYIDNKDQIYIVGTIDGVNGVGEFLVKYSPEGNIVWQKERHTTPYVLSDGAPNVVPVDVNSDGETGQTVVLSVWDRGPFAQYDSDIFISKYSKNGDLVFRRTISKGYNNLGSASLDADPSFYYLLFRDQRIDGVAGEPDRYTFGKVSTSGNGLGNFFYDDGVAPDIDYLSPGTIGITTLPMALYNDPLMNKIGRLSDGSVRNDSSDLITYPFTANQVVFDDLATPVSNKKKQLDTADSFEYSGSPAIRVVDFQRLNLLGHVYSGSGPWLDQSRRGNDTENLYGYHATYNSDGYFENVGGSPSVRYLPLGDKKIFAFTGNFTVELWVYPTTGENTSANTIFSTDDFSIQMNGSGEIAVKTSASTPPSLDSSTATVNYNAWNHILVYRKNSIYYTNVNGTEEQLTVTDFTLSSNTSNAELFRDVDGLNKFFAGRIGELRIYPRALTEAQVFQNYNATKSKYVSQAPSIAPSIGPDIVTDSSLILSCDFSSKIVYDPAENLVSSNASWVNQSNGTATDSSTKSVFGRFDCTRITGFTQVFSPTFSLYGGAYKTFNVPNGGTHIGSCYARSRTGEDQNVKFGLNTYTDGVSVTLPASGEWIRIDSGPKTLSSGNRTFVLTSDDEPIDIDVSDLQVQGGSEVGRYIKTYASPIVGSSIVKSLSSDVTLNITGDVKYNPNGYFEFQNPNTVGTFTSPTSYMEVSGFNGLANTSFTASFWFKTYVSESDSREEPILTYTSEPSNNNATTNEYFSVAVGRDRDQTGNDEAVIRAGGNGAWGGLYGNGANLTSDLNLTGDGYPLEHGKIKSNTWHRVDYVYDHTGNGSNGTHALYIDGAAAGSANVKAGFNDTQYALSDGGRLRIGANFGFGGTSMYGGDEPEETATGANNYGYVGEIQIYNRLCSPAEISKNYEATRGKYGV